MHAPIAIAAYLLVVCENVVHGPGIVDCMSRYMCLCMASSYWVSVISMLYCMAEDKPARGLFQYPSKIA